MGNVITLPTEGEQNRLIIEFMHLVEPIAAGYRGAKNIPFEDLLAEGRVGLVSAARRFQHGDFEGYAAVSIRNAIRRFIRNWEEFVSISEKLEDRDFYEWQVYPDLSLGESWTVLAASPEELTIAFEEANRNTEALQTAIKFLPPKERAMINARFFREPRQSLNSIAREHKMSYWATVKTIYRTLERLKDAVKSREAATPSAARG